MLEFAIAALVFYLLSLLLEDIIFPLIIAWLVYIILTAGGCSVTLGVGVNINSTDAVEQTEAIEQ